MKKKLELILAAMGKMSGISKAEIEAKLDFDEATSDEDFATALESVLDSHASAVKKKAGKDYSDGHKAAKSDVLEDFETKLKAKFKVTDTDKKGLDLVDQIVESVQETSKGGKGMTEDDVKKHPAYLELEKNSQKAIKDAQTDAENKIKEVKDGITRTQHLAELVSEGMAEFDKLNPVLPSDAAAATRRRNAFQKKLEQSINFEVAENGDRILLDSKGARLEDKHGHLVKLGDIIKPLADDDGFEYKVATDRSSTGLGGNNGQGGAAPNGTETKPPKFNGALPKKGDSEAYNAIMLDEKISDDAKIEVMTHWETVNK